MSPQPLGLHLIGFGGVGQAVAEALIPDGVTRGAPPFRVVAITDSRGTLESASATCEGLDLQLAVEAKRAGRLSSAAAPGAAVWLEGDTAVPAIRRVTADVVIDLTPTNLDHAEPAATHVEEALRHGRHVVTANKGPVALHHAHLVAVADRAGVTFAYAATVCGGVPILEALAHGFAGDHVERIEGVVNGSTNFILTEMESGASFEEALLTARTRGILEADASLDILGHDARAKACILHNHVYGKDHGYLALGDVAARGIQGLTTRDVQDARRNGYAVRLVAAVEPGRARVRPVHLPADHALVVDGTSNAVQVKCALAGAVTFTGAGAGARETASAVLGDVARIAASRPPVPEARPLAPVAG